MDIETTAAIERLTERVDALAATMQAGFGSVRAELRSEVGSVRAELGSKVGSVHAEVGGLRAELGSLRAEVADNRRHTQGLFESLQHDIRIVAEGVATLSAKFDARPQ